MTSRQPGRGGPLWAAIVPLNLGLALPVQGATRFVATSGADGGNTCLVAGSPCRTITRALGQAVASDTISASPGIYNLALGETFPLTISKNLSLVDAGARSTILDATGASRTVVFVFSASVAIAELTVTGGGGELHQHREQHL